MSRTKPKPTIAKMSGPCEKRKGEAIATIRVGLPTKKREERRLSGLPIPDDIDVKMMIDTGSDHTFIPPEVVDRLGLQPVGQSYTFGFGERGESHLAHWARVTFAPLIVFDEFLVFSRGPLDNRGLGILGRQVLNRGVFTVDGPKRRWEFSWDLAELSKPWPVYQYAKAGDPRVLPYMGVIMSDEHKESINIEWD